MPIENEQEFRERCRYMLHNNTINSYVSWLNSASIKTGINISTETLATSDDIDNMMVSLINSNSYNQKTINNIQSAMKKYIEVFKNDLNVVANQGHILKQITYDDLNSRQKEIFNFQKVAALLADYGFNCIKLSDDWQGADFLAYPFNGDKTLKIQLKSRITINKKYLEKDLFITFPNKGYWFLIEHDGLVKLIEKTTGWLDTSSWKDKGSYSSKNINRELLHELAQFKL